MRSCLALLVLVLASSSSYGGFTFKFEHALNRIAKGSSDTLKIFAAWDGTGTSNLSGFGNVSLSGPTSISFTSGSSQGPNLFGLTATSFSFANFFQQVGSVGVQVSGSAADSDQATLNLSAVDGSFNPLGTASTIVAIPEPSSMALFGLVSVCGLVFRRRR